MRKLLVTVTVYAISPAFQDDDVDGLVDKVEEFKDRIEQVRGLFPDGAVHVDVETVKP